MKSAVTLGIQLNTLKLLKLDYQTNRQIIDFLAKRPPLQQRFWPTLNLYAKLFKGKKFPVNESILHKLANPDQTPSQNALCAFYFANPSLLLKEYSSNSNPAEFEDVSMVTEHPAILRCFTSRIAKGKSVLSLGIGEAPIETKLVKKGVNVSAIEFVPSLAEKAKKSGINAVCGEIHQELARTTGQYDFIIMSEVLGDLDVPFVLSRLPRLMHGQTKLLISTYLPSPKADGTGFERMWTRTLEKPLLKNGLKISKKRTWRIVKNNRSDEETIEEAKDGYEFDDGYGFYVIENMGGR